LLTSLLFVSSAHALTPSVGAIVAVSADLPDASSKDYVRFGAGPSLQVPIRLELTKVATIRATLRSDFSMGQDRLSWAETVDGIEYRFYDDDHRAFLSVTSFTIGPELYAPIESPVIPYFGAEAGGAIVGTYHSLGGEQYAATQVLLDPDQNDLSNPRNLDPFTSQMVFVTDFHVGGRIGVSERLAVYVETGYSVAFVAAHPLRKTPEALNAMREAYGWNAFRGGVGFGLSF
jgi:hypothetical protein